MISLVFVCVWTACIFATVAYAATDGRDVLLWFMFSVFTGPVALLCAAILGEADYAYTARVNNYYTPQLKVYHHVEKKKKVTQKHTNAYKASKKDGSNVTVAMKDADAAEKKYLEKPKYRYQFTHDDRSDKQNRKGR